MILRTTTRFRGRSACGWRFICRGWKSSAARLLILRRFYAGALTLILALTLVFIGATASARLRGIDISCGCFGHASDNLGFVWHLLLNLAILAAVALLMRRVTVQRSAA